MRAPCIAVNEVSAAPRGGLPSAWLRWRCGCDPVLHTSRSSSLLRLQVRVAGYRLLAALALRPWAAAEAAGHEALLERLLDPGGEVAPQAAQWRRAAVASLHEGITAALQVRRLRHQRWVMRLASVSTVVLTGA